MSVTQVRGIRGHDCSLNVGSSVVTDEIKTGWSVPWKRRFFAFIIADPRRPITKRVLRSTAEIEQCQRRQLQRHPYKIHPFSRARLCWELLMIPVFTFYFLGVPYYFNGEQVVLQTILDCLMMIDIAMNFVTGYVNDNHRVILNTKKIAIHYLKGYFFFDAISSGPFYLVMYYADFIHVSMLVLLYLKLLRLRVFYNYLDRINVLIKVPVHFLKLLKSFISLLIVNMWTTITLGILMGKTDGFSYQLYRVIKIYVLAGPTTPFTLKQSIVHLLIIHHFVAAIYHIVIIANLVEMYAKYASSVNENEAILDQMKSFMNSMGIQQNVKAKVVDYIRFKQKNCMMNETKLLETLSTNLQREIMQFNMQKLVENVEFFNDLPKDIILRILMKLKHILCLPDDVIIQSGTMSNSMYFLSSGTVAIYNEAGKELYHLSEGNHFGEISFILNDINNATVIAVQYCELYRLTRRDFSEAMEPFPDLLESIRESVVKHLEKTFQI